jgi:two-component system, chemotaxis family, protein-glutamate methylesterase/glutaminase
MNRKIKVLIVDDSAIVRQVLVDVLKQDPQIEVIGSALDPIFAMEKMAREWPDVLVVDIEMPRMDGIAFLKQIMATRPTPVVICSTLTAKGSEMAMKALSAGAVGVVTKPTEGLKKFLAQDEGGLIQSIKSAAHSNMSRMNSVLSSIPSTSHASTTSPKKEIAEKSRITPDVPHYIGRTTDRVVAIGTSTGGTQALEVVLTALTPDTVGIVIVQHMPEQFTQAFANRLNQHSQIQVREARSGDRVLRGSALIAPGGKHLEVRRNGAQYVVEVFDGPLVNRHRPSVDVLFRSVAKCVGNNALGIIMTGMGDDGARGLKEMFDVGAHTIAQDEASCVVYGMPKEAVKLGGVSQSLPLKELSSAIQKFGGRFN